MFPARVAVNLAGCSNTRGGSHLDLPRG
jgi:hypothetical protein